MRAFANLLSSIFVGDCCYATDFVGGDGRGGVVSGRDRRLVTAFQR